MHEVGDEVGKWFEHEGVLEFVTWNLQMAGAVEDEVVVENDIDVEWTRSESWPAAVAAVGVFEGVQPVVQCEWIEVAVDDGGGIEEFCTDETDRDGASS